MKIYQVGGCVRDMLRGVIPQDYDHVVVGSDIAEMLSLGFIQVGKSFPVFLHPETKQEYALARKEIKIGDKHTDFRFIFDKSITLKEDLRRRDFRCNAIALDTDTNQIFDPYHGQEDIKNHILRHIDDEHFPEDPLRVLRLCRFAAQLNYTCAPETLALARQMVANNMLSHLSAERIGQELEKALKSPNFNRFIATADTCGAWKFLFPQADNHELIQSLEDFFARTSLHNSLLSLALLLYKISGFEPNLTLAEQEDLIRQICKHLHTPNKYREFALACRHYASVAPNDIRGLTEFALSVYQKDKNFIQDLGEFYRIIVVSDNLPISDNEVLLKIINILSQTKAQDMPDYQSLPKDKNFGKIYRRYQIAEVLKHF